MEVIKIKILITNKIKRIKTNTDVLKIEIHLINTRNYLKINNNLA